MTTPHERSVGARMERKAMRSWARRRVKTAHVFGDALWVKVDDLLEFIEGRQKRYDRKPGGLGAAMNTTPERAEIHPFSNGSEFMAWDEENCCHCGKGWRNRAGERIEDDNPYFLCPIQQAVMEGTFTGVVPLEIAERMGFFTNAHNAAGIPIWGWPCAEFIRE